MSESIMIEMPEQRQARKREVMRILRNAGFASDRDLAADARCTEAQAKELVDELAAEGAVDIDEVSASRRTGLRYYPE
jgi:hypothetical protein